MSMTAKRALLGAAIAGSFALVTTFAFAEESIEQVTVTARRVEENIQTVPITIQAFSAEKLRESNVKEVRELMYQTPGLLTTGSASLNNQTYLIRGQGNSGQQGHGIPGVVSYFADVPLPFNAQSQPQYDVANIQVLKGPQGTLFGRNTVGGAVLVNPAVPDYDGIHGYFDATGGKYSWWQLEGAINVPLIDDQLALRVAARGEHRNGYVKNIGVDPVALTEGAHNPGGDGMELNNYSFRAQLRWDPTGWLKNNLMFDYYNADDANTGFSIIYTDNGKAVPPTQFQLALPAAALIPLSCAGPPLNGIVPPVPFDTFCVLPQGPIGNGNFDHENIGNFQPNEYIRQMGITDRLDADLGPVQFTNIFGYRTDRYDSFLAPDGVPFVFLKPLQRTNEAQLTDEVHLRGKLLDDHVDWLLGGFYYKSDPLTGNVGTNVILPALAAPSPAGYPFYASESKAVFGHADIKLDELLQGLSAELGYRYTWDDYSLCTAVAGTAFNAFPFNPLTGAPTPYSAYNLSPSQCRNPTTLVGSGALAAAGVANGKSSAPGWVLGLNWQATDNIFLYATTRHGYRAGQLNGPTFGAGTSISALQAVSPERTTDFEIGAKTNWNWDDTPVLFDLSLFQAETKNVQQGTLQVATGEFDQLAFPGYLAAISPGGSLAAGLAAQQAAGFSPAPTVGPLAGLWIPCSPQFLGGPPPVGTGTNFDRNCSTLDDPTQTIVTYNAGNRTVRGIELQASVQPTDRLTLNLAATLYAPKNSLKLSEVPAAIRPFVVTQLNLTPAQVANPNTTLPSAVPQPNRTMTAGLRYELPFIDADWGDVIFNTNFYWSDKYPIAGTGYTQPQYNLVNFRLDWNSIDGMPLDFSFFVTNAFNTHYAVASGDFFTGALVPAALAPVFASIGNTGMVAVANRGVAAVVPGEPQMFGVTLRYHFGDRH